MTAQEIIKQLRKLADPERAAHSARYFKTGPGEYGEGDHFLGIRVPAIRAQVKRCEFISLAGIKKLLMSGFHEIRLCALLLLVRKFENGDKQTQETIFDFYLQNIQYVNNWDLVDSSASQIVGSYLANRDRQLLYKLIKSASLWERRIAIIATFQFIRDNQFEDSLKFARQFLNDKEDLIHKAVGWMLREIGKRDVEVEKKFLQHHYNNMPRTMLRYAIEKFPEQVRKKYLSGEM
jgi:3-methyladenine DNA glycosylase AlkD